MKEVNILKVAGKSAVSSVSGSIIKSIEDGKGVELHTIGASSISQCVKAMASARGVLATKGYNVSFIPGFGMTKIDGEEITMMIFKLVIN